MIIESTTRAFAFGCLTIYIVIADRASAQTTTGERSETPRHQTAAPTHVEAGQSSSTAGVTNEDLWNLLSSVSDRVDINISRVTDAKNASEEVRDGVRDGVSALTGQLRSAIDGALEDLKRIVADELGGAEFIAFTDGPNSCSAATCEPFRTELDLLLVDFESTANGLFTVTGWNQMQLDFARVRGIVGNLPGRLLFPLYLVFKTDHGDLLGSLSGLLAELRADLDLVVDVFATDAATASAEGTTTPTCTAMVENPLVFEVIILRNTARAIGLKLVAKIFDALGETSATADAGLHGYVHITYEENFPKKFAAILGSLSESEFYIADAVESKLEFCLMLQLKIDAQQRQLELLDGQAQILSAIQGNADLNGDGKTNLTDYTLLHANFETGKPRP